ncbi:hypothetical protein OG599_13905 [Streptomyces sp. NBC_01335]|uniref:hypothetical protein n=1 Tax=Streptomyces sp. NBC_01335 TaxID=2903828 RepID=UPI002E0E0D3E|nr:hypothetical protein OG599_13905 [Streptomyces sp. NBC_01335]
MLTDPTNFERETSAALLRAAMEHASDQAQPPGDLVAGAVVQGRRRRARAQIAMGAGVTAAVALGIFAVTAPGSSGAPAQATGVGSAPDSGRDLGPGSDPTAEYRTPVHVVPSPGESSMADLPAAERKRQQRFQQTAATTLDHLLPGTGTIRPVDLRVDQYQLTDGSAAFPLTFSVRPEGKGEDHHAAACVSDPAKHLTCRQVVLPGGIHATARTSAMNSLDTTGISVEFGYGDSLVEISVLPDDLHAASAPVTVEQLTTITGDADFMRLVAYADKHPMEEERTTVVGG